MKIHVVTLFPSAVAGWLEGGVMNRATKRGLVEVDLVDLRRFGLGRHLQVDDYPFGGGAGMVLKPEPIFAAVEQITEASSGPIILLTPRGRLFNQSVAEELVGAQCMTLIAGHYEGVDERVAHHLATHEISVGSFVLSGGEVPAMTVIEAVTRLIPGAIDENSHVEESFTADRLEYPQYTRPAMFRGWQVPEILLSGDHAKIAQWRLDESLKRTREVRPGLGDDPVD
jgi:tRNA (guanine37-N1)-methyltransferase